MKYAEIVPENIDLYRTRSTSSWLPSLPGVSDNHGRIFSHFYGHRAHREKITNKVRN